MASDEIKKKWGTIFMGNREASVQQLQAMQEPLRREKQQKEYADDYMERVRSRAADRAREILGAAYAERQKILEEARADAARYRKDAELDAIKLKAEEEKAKAKAALELQQASSIREEAEKIRLGAQDTGYQEGMQQAAAELNEFRANLGMTLGSLLRAIERERHQILEVWRNDLVELVQCASQAGASYVLKKEHRDVLKNLVFKALDLLENRNLISLRVNPQDEEIVNEIFQTARNHFPELKQWVINADPSIERGGLVAESGTGSVDLRRENFREMLDGVLDHLGLPEGEIEAMADQEIREMVERDVASIAGLTPELDKQENPPEISENADEIPHDEPAPTAPDENTVEINKTPEQTDSDQPGMNPERIEASEEFQEDEIAPVQEPAENPTLEDLEEELFPIDENLEENDSAENHHMPVEDNPAQVEHAEDAREIDPLEEGGFL